ncbi:MAG TPA: YceI family protein [Blastocatellia bacterium]|nr:YceI family protein [Blastocatellia bacterium]
MASICAVLALAPLGSECGFLSPRTTSYLTKQGANRSIAQSPGPSARYKLDAGQSRFLVKAFAGGFLSAFAHDHTIAIRDFSGHADFTYGTVEPASLEMTIKAASLEVTDKVSASDRQKIEGTMRDEVLEVSKYPEIVFKSNGVNANKIGEGKYQARISGELTLHGVTRPSNINAELEFGDRILRAKGAFTIKQTTFSIKPVSIAGGTVKVKDELKFTFDVVAHP